MQQSLAGRAKNEHPYDEIVVIGRDHSTLEPYLDALDTKWQPSQSGNPHNRAHLRIASIYDALDPRIVHQQLTFTL